MATKMKTMITIIKRDKAYNKLSLNNITRFDRQSRSVFVQKFGVITSIFDMKNFTNKHFICIIHVSDNDNYYQLNN